LVAVVPVLLGLIVMLIGRLGFSNVPARACAKGPALLSVLATIVVLAGVLAICFPSVAYLFTSPYVPPTPDQPLGSPGGGAGTPPPPSVPLAQSESMPLGLFPPEDPSGLIQRFGFLLGAVMLVIGEFWFVSAIGRVGAHLSDGKTAGRATRYLMLLGLAVVVTVGVVGLAPTAFGYGSEAEQIGKETGGLIRQQWEFHVRPLLEKLGEYRPILMPSVFLGVGLLLGVIYFRLVGAARGAIREWLNRNGTA